MKKRVNRFIYWTPRIVSILFLCFLTIFSLDIFDLKLGFWGTVLGLFMHNIPVLILLGVLLIAWKYEIVGGIVYLLAGLLYITMLTIRQIGAEQFQWYMLSYSMIIAGPAFIIGILFLLNWFKKKK